MGNCTKRGENAKRERMQSGKGVGLKAEARGKEPIPVVRMAIMVRKDLAIAESAKA